MEKAVFRKENVFTCVMFGALVLFVVVETIMAPESLPAIAFFVAISVFALSIIKVSADIAESMNDRLTTHMKVVENRWKSQHGSFRGDCGGNPGPKLVWPSNRLPYNSPTSGRCP